MRLAGYCLPRQTPIAISMDQSRPVTPRGAVIMGALFIACGLFPVLTASASSPDPEPDAAPAWVIMPLASCSSRRPSVILGYGIAGGVGPDGDLKPGTPLVIRCASLLLGLMIVGLMLSVFGWVAFGRGARHFSTSVSLPFVSQRWQSADLIGRVVFGFGALLLAVMFVVAGFTGVRKLVSAIRARS